MILTEIKRQPTWTSAILSLEVNEEMNAPYDKKKVIAPLLSRNIKLKHPERSFTTRKEILKMKKREKAVLVIRRTA